MIEFTIDGQAVSAAEGTTLMDAARGIGIAIPAMCHNGDLPHFTSCMICVVKEEASGKLLTSCSVKARPGMRITTMSDEIREARKTALDLLLSDHTGDCEAPCTMSCPAHMDIPLMNHLLAEGKFEEAYNVVIQDIALPSVLGRICPAPCEGACRRKSVDEAVAICMLKRHAGDEVLKEEGRSQRFELRILNAEITDSGIPKEEVPRHASRITRHDSSASRVTRHDSSASRITPHDSPVTRHSSLVTSKKHVAVIGSGPHGLSAAWYLQSFGYQCTIFDRNPLPGGALRYSVPRELLPLETLDAEIDRIRRSGVLFEMNAEIDIKNTAELEDRFDAVVYPLDRALKMAIRASALGKEAAWKVRQRLSGEAETGEPRLFNSRFGRLQEPEFAEYLKESVPGHRVEPARGIPEGMTAEEVMAEAARCLHCECRKADNCLLRNFSDEYRADQKRFQGPERKMVTKQFQHNTVVYEPLKCIKCGICVRITAMHGEEYGLTFIGRGFDVVVGVPFNETIREGLTKTAEEAAGACPTGALAMKGRAK